MGHEAFRMGHAVQLADVLSRLSGLLRAFGVLLVLGAVSLGLVHGVMLWFSISDQDMPSWLSVLDNAVAWASVVLLVGLVLMVVRVRRVSKQLAYAEHLQEIESDSRPVLLWNLDAQGNSTYVNQYALDFSGKTLDELLGQGWVDGIHPDDQARVIEVHEVGIEKREPIRVEYRYKRFDDEYRWMLDQGNPVYDQAGSFQGYAGIVVDITDRKNAELLLEEEVEQRRDSEERLSLLMDKTGVIWWEYCLDTDRFVRLSPQFASVFGVGVGPWEDLASWQACIHPDDRERATQLCLSQVDSSVPVAFEYRVQRADGSYIWIQEFGSPVTGGDGRVTLRGVMIDIDDLVRERERANEEAERLRLLLDTSEVVWWEFDVDQDTYTYVSAQAGRVMGYDAEYFTDCASWESVVHVEDLEAFRGFQGHVERRENYEFKWRLRKPDGTYTWFQSAVNVSDSSTGGALLRGTSVNIDELTRTRIDAESSSNRLRQILETTGAMSWEFSLSENRYTYISPQSRQLYGLEPEDWTDLAFWESLIHPAQREEMALSCAAAVEKGKDHELLLKMRDANGDYVWFKEIISVIDAGDGSVFLRGVSFSIQELVDARELAEESSAKLRQHIESTPAAVIDFGPDMSIQSWNRAAEETFGWTAEEAIGQGALSLLVPEDIHEWLQAEISRELQSALMHSITNDNVTKDGRRITCEWLATPIFDKQGNLVQLSTISHDVTDRVLADRAMQRLRGHIDNTPLAVMDFEAGDELVIASWNRSAERIFGWKAGEIIGKSAWGRVIPEDIKPWLMDRVRQALDQEPLGSVTNENITKDGRRITCTWHNTPIFGESGNLVSLSSLALDVTELMGAERAAQRLKGHFDNTPLAVVDFDAGEELLVSGWNPAAEKIFGWTAEEVIGKNAWDFLVPEDVKPWLMERVEEVLQSDSYEPVVNENLTKDGRRITCHWHNTPIRDSQGKLVALSSLALDVTERMNSAKQIEESEMRYRMIAENTSDVITRYSSRFELEFVSLSCESVLGYSPTEFAAMDRSTIVHPDDLPKLAGARQEVGRKGARSLFRYRVRHADGHYLWAEAIAKAVESGPDDDDFYIIVSTRDITQRVEQERQTSEFFRLSPTIVAILDREATFVEVNGAVTNLLGYSIDEFKGKNAFDLIHADDQERAKQAMSTLYDGGSVSEVAVRYLNAQGGWTWIAWNAVIEPGAEPHLDRMYSIGMGLGEVMAAREALEQSERKYRGLIEDQTELLCRFTPDCTLTFVNGAYARAFGGEPEDYIGVNFLQFVDEQHRERVLGRVRSLTPENPTKTYIEQLDVKEGEPEQWQEWTNRGIFDEDGQIVECQGVGRDITERVNSAKEIRRSSKAQSLLLRELDHRVKNSLGGLLTLIDLCAARETTVDGVSSSLRRRVRAMADVHAMLSASRWEPVSLAEIFRVMIPADVRCEVNIVGPTVLISPRQATPMGVVIQELMTNAMKYGVLGMENAKLCVEWNTGQQDLEHQVLPLELSWVEKGGNGFEASPEPGLGTSLMSGFARSELRGKLELGYTPAGVHHTLHARLDLASQEGFEAKPAAFWRSEDEELAGLSTGDLGVIEKSSPDAV